MEAARAAISSPLLETSLDGATGILLNITGGADLGLAEADEAAQVVTASADPNANVIFGAVIDDSMGDHIRVTAIATGFGGRPRRRRVEPQAEMPEPAERPAIQAPSVTDVEIDIPSFLKDD
jgi:cell division protein FtsZ